MKVALCQFDIEWENKAANHAKVRGMLDASRQLCQDALIVLPEMFSTGFSMNVAEIQEGAKRQTEHFMRDLARDFNAVVVGGAVGVSDCGKGLNQSVVFSPAGAELARYSKMQPFSLSGEAANYAAGNAPAQFSMGGFQIAPFVCYDLRFPEIFRSAAMRGAQVFTVIANWPLPRDAHWTALLRARAIENQAYVVGVNRCGRDPRYVYPGRSVVVDPWGNILADAGNGESVIGAELSLQTLLDYRRDFPALADIRPEFRAVFAGL